MASELSLGNLALRDQDPVAAIQHYLRALEEMPALSKVIGNNMALARRKFVAERPGRERLRVAVCGWELAHNAAGRVQTLAMLYRQFADVEIVGSLIQGYGTEVWGPIGNSSIPRHTFLVQDESRYIAQAMELVSAHPYDLVHLSKPRAPTIFIGLLYQLIWGSRILVDIDDEELAFTGAETPVGVDDYLQQHGALPALKGLDGRDWTRLAVGLATQFDGITVSNPALQKRYGGELVHHARDERRYRPTAALRRASRQKFGIGESQKVVLFCGTPREHKGLLETADAIAALGRDDVVFAIVGDFADLGIKARLLERKGVDYRFIGNQPFDSMPEVVAMGDVVVLLPDSNSQIARFQVPAKLSDALGMGLVVLSGLSADVIDQPLRRAVIKVTPATLATTLGDILRDPRRAAAQRKAGAIAFAGHLGLVSNAVPLRELASAQGQGEGRVAALGLRLLKLLPAASLPASVSALLEAQPAALGAGVSVIVLTLNAASLLDRMLTSFFAVNTYRPVEMIVIDHGSTDGTAAVVARHANKGRLRHIDRGENFSFSDSCNFGANLASYPQLLFLNNDIVYTADVLPLATTKLADATIGAVGVRLDDVPGLAPPGRPLSVQHTGIVFRWNEARQYHQPEQIRHPTLAAAASAGSGIVAAVTGAFLLCRKSDFSAIGGFSPDYHYGLEDIDLCLRLARLLRKSSWCINELSLQHVEGATRNAEPGRFSEAIERNHALFKRLWAEVGKRLAEGKPLLSAADDRSLSAPPPPPEAEPAPTPDGAPTFAWTRSADFSPAPGLAVLELAGAALGKTPDGADSAASLPGLQSLRGWCALHGLVPGQVLGLRRATGDAEPWAAEGEKPTLANPFDRIGSHALIADVWFTTDFKLRLRVEAQSAGAMGDTPCVLRSHQFDPALGTLRLTTEVPVSGDGPVFADFELLNPYNPLLLTATGADGVLIGVNLLPFPSLCRGGAHHGEGVAVGESSGYIASLTRLSNHLLTELTAAEPTSEYSIARLAIDLTGATGAEKIFSAPVQEWLSGVMRMGALVAEGGASAGDDIIRRYLEEALHGPAQAAAGKKNARRVAAREAGAGLTLLLAADSLPMIGALVSRRLHMPDEVEAAVGPYVLAHAVTGRPRTIVSLPPMGDALLALQPREQPICFPVLRRTPGPARASTGNRTDAVTLPLAIKYRMPQRDHPASLMSPLAADAAGPVLRRALSATERRAATVSVLVCLRTGVTEVSGLLESVARQSLAAAVDVVVALEAGAAAERPALDKLLNELFPGRHAVVEVAGRNRSADLNLAANRARGQCFLIADEAALMHDARTLETLYTLLLDGQVATAACVLLREIALKKGSEVRYHSGGFYPGQLSFQGTPSLIFSEPYTLSAFPNASYPVVGNSFRLALVSAKVWAALGGLDELNFPSHRQDLDFCLRALKSGHVHLCTSAVTAANLSDGGAEEHADTHTLGFMPLQRWQDIFSAVTVLRELDT